MTLDSISSIVAAAAAHGLTLVDPTLDTSGLDFVVVKAGTPDGVRWIVRAPRRPDVADAARKEARVLAAVKAPLATIGVAVPDWRVHADVIAYPLVEGTPMITLDTGAPVWNFVDPAAPSAEITNGIGQLLAALQRVSSSELPSKTIAAERADLERSVPKAVELLSPPDWLLAQWRGWIANDALWPTHTALVHADMHPGHIIMQPPARIVGILDWTEAHVGDPGIDFAMLYRCFGRAALAAIVDAFAAAGGVTWPGLVEHAIQRAAWGPAYAAAWADRAGNVAVLEMARTIMAQYIAEVEQAASPVQSSE